MPDGLFREWRPGERYRMQGSSSGDAIVVTIPDTPINRYALSKFLSALPPVPEPDDAAPGGA